MLYILKINTSIIFVLDFIFLNHAFSPVTILNLTRVKMSIIKTYTPFNTSLGCADDSFDERNIRLWNLWGFVGSLWAQLADRCVYDSMNSNTRNEDWHALIWTWTNYVDALGAESADVFSFNAIQTAPGPRQVQCVGEQLAGNTKVEGKGRNIGEKRRKGNYSERNKETKKENKANNRNFSGF